MNEKTIFALGFFDGVHLGHQALLRACWDLADRHGLRSGVVTFASHPDGLVQGAAPQLINNHLDRRFMLHQFGMDTVLELPFNKSMMTMPWQDFFRLLTDRHHAAGFVCGHDFRFGNRGEGNASLLQALCAKHNMPCTVVPEQTVDGITVSSTYIRTLLEQGDLDNAVKFLGHPHVLTGQVVPGRHLGRTIGVPTANLELPDWLVQPKLGVYACTAHVNEQTYPAVTNIGTRPTVGGNHVTVEPWILDFEGDLYGQTITLHFHKYLRPERKFNSLEQLQAEIQKNAEETRKILENL